MSNENESVHRRRTWDFSFLSYAAVATLSFMLPVFVFPWLGLGVDQSKKFLFVAVALMAIVAWAVGRLQEGRIQFPRAAALPAAFVVLVATFASALFAPSVSNSLSGIGYDQGTALSLAAVFALFFLASTLFQSKTRVFNLYLGLFAAAALAFLFQASRLVLGQLVSFELFANPAVNLVGKWNSLGIFFGFVLVSLLVVWEFFAVKSVKVLKMFLMSLMAASLVVMALVNLLAVWVVVGLFALGLFAYRLRLDVGEEDSAPLASRVLTRPVFLVLVVAVLFVTLGRAGALGQPGGIIAEGVGKVNAALGISVLEVRPSASGTADIAGAIFQKDPVLGSGPNTFADQWLLHKPQEINQTLFWNVNFDSGVGSVPTFMATTGLIGSVAWAAFMLALLYAFYLAFRLDRSSPAKPFVLLAAAGALYLWVFMVIYPLDAALYGLAFITAGALLAVLVEAKAVAVADLSLSSKGKFGFAATLATAFLVVAGLAGGYLLAQRLWSVADHQRAVALVNAGGDVTEAEQLVERAIAFGDHELYRRTMVDLLLLRLNRTLTQEDLSQQAAADAVRDLFNRALLHADAAITLNEANFLNYVYRGKVYEAVVPLKIEGMYEKAVEAYNKAKALNPSSPALALEHARLEIAKGDAVNAKARIAEALKLKPDFTNALFLLSQLEASEGNLDEAIARSVQAATIAPDDIGLLFQLGYLRYTDDDFEGATEALERAVSINPQYSNAKYFLGLSYDELGDRSKALKQFEELVSLNPGNAEVQAILENLEAGLPALEGVASQEAQEPAGE